jgi:hypothetical protein
MNEEELKRLIEKYYNGESTEQEERTLRDYFGNNDIPYGYEAEKVIFNYYTESAGITGPSADFEAQILAGIDASEKVSGSMKMRKYILPILSAAAGLLFITGLYFLFTDRIGQKDTFTDPELAYTETMKILRDVSYQLNNGARVLEPIGKINEMTKKSFETINRSTRIVEKNLKSLDYLKRAIDTTQDSVENNVNK